VIAAPSESMGLRFRGCSRLNRVGDLGGDWPGGGGLFEVKGQVEQGSVLRDRADLSKSSGEFERDPRER
jgi:hypothetical protein